MTWQAGHNVYFAHVDPLGSMPDSPTRLTDDGILPSLDWTGSGFGVCWTKPHTDTFLDDEMHFTFLSPTGREIVADSRIDAEHPGGCQLIWYGREFGLLSSGVYMNSLSPDGSVLGTDVRISPQEGVSEGGRAVWTGSAIAVPWSWCPDDATNWDIYLSLLMPCP